MPVMNSNGELFDERRKDERRKLDIPVDSERRVGDRRVEDLNKPVEHEHTENLEELPQEENLEVPAKEPVAEPAEVAEVDETVETESEDSSSPDAE